MSRGINKAILVGNLGRDPEISYTPGGMAIAKLSLATTESRKAADGNWTDITEWHRVTVFGKTAESISQNASKGSQLYIEGRIHYDSYEKDGIKRYTTDIIANVVRLLGRREDSGGGGGGSYESGGGGQSRQSNSGYPAPKDDFQPGPDGDMEDDLPF